MRPRLRIAALVFGSVLAAVAADAEPVTVRDALDRLVTIASPPQRVVTVFSSNTELVAALGLTDRIVGIDAFTRYPPEILDRSLIGGRLGMSVDATVTLRPDLVVVTPARQAAFQLVDPMERLGIPVIVLMQRDVAEIVANLRLLGQALGVPDRGEAVADALQRRLSETTERVRELPAPRVVMIRGRVGNGLLLVAQAGTYTGDAIVRAGGRFALADSTIAQASPEAIFAADPDILLYAGSQRELDDLIAEPWWSRLRAVTSHRAYAVSRAELLIPGPRTIDGVEHLAAIFHPMAPTQ
jgi:iron complex transport system substrate-binding protein